MNYKLTFKKDRKKTRLMDIEFIPNISSDIFFKRKDRCRKK